LRDIADVLTQREVDVARLAATGESSRAIADRFFLSVRTVDNHLHSVYRKLELTGREELAVVLGPTPSSPRWANE
jgi:DNA-binding CsgD family transcriptional regulator